MSYIISGIQQVGIGIPDVEKAWKWYRCHFGMDIPVFREAADAPLMTRYTGGKVHSRDAVLAVNLQGGGGFEIWQYTSRKTAFPENSPVLGDTGIFATKIKSPSVEKAYKYLKEEKGCEVLGEPETAPDGEKTFFLKDPWGNYFQVVKSNEWFGKPVYPTGGPQGALIGVSDIDKALVFYSGALGFDSVVYDEKGTFKDLFNIDGGTGEFRRVLLKRTDKPAGPFSPIFGSAKIELIQSLERTPNKIFENRFWGDAGFIHLCFDVQGMDALGEKLSSAGFPFTIDSGSRFDMGEAAGRFTYVEDPDGTLIEFVETLKVPIVKKLGWYIDLSKKPMGKALPKFVLKAMGLGREKGGC